MLPYVEVIVVVEADTFALALKDSSCETTSSFVVPVEDGTVELASLCAQGVFMRLRLSHSRHHDEVLPSFGECVREE